MINLKRKWKEKYSNKFTWEEFLELLIAIQRDVEKICAADPWQDGEPSVNYQSTYLLEFEENDEHDSYIRMGTWSYGDNPRLVDLDNRCPFEDKVKRHAPINLPERNR